MPSRACYMGLSPSSQINTERCPDFSFPPEQATSATMDMVANNSWFPQTLRYTNKMAGNLPPFPRLEKHAALLCLPARMEKIRGERQKHEQKEVADADLLPRVPISFLPGPLRPETPLQNTGNFLHCSVDPFCTATNPQTHLLNGKAMPRPLQPQRREHGQVTAT